MSNNYSADLELSSSQSFSITNANQTGLSITGDITIEWWFKLEQLPSTAGSDFGIISKWDGVNGYTLKINSSDTLFFNGENANNRLQIFSDGAIVDSDDVGEWVHIAMTIDASTMTGIVYKNKVSFGVTYGNKLTTSWGTTANDFYVGRDVYDNYLDGLINNLRVWNDIRTPTEISDNYESVLNSEAGLVLSVFNEAEDGDDLSSSGNDLTNNNSATFVTDVPFSQSNVANITIDSSKVDADLTDYPIYIDLSDLPSSFWDTVANGGGDIRVYKSDGTTQLAREIVSCEKGLRNSTHSTDLELSSSQYWSIIDGDQTGLDFTDDFTIESWVKPESQPATNIEFPIYTVWGSSSSTDQKILWKYEDAAGVKRLRLYYRASGTSTSLSTIEYNITLSTTEWTHIALAVDVSNNANTKLYINGEEVTITSRTNTATSLKDVAQTITIGTRSTVSGFYDGKINDVRIWDDIRTADEIKDNYFKELNGNEDNLQGYWKFNNDGLDETSNNNDLTNNNTATFSTDVPEFTGELHVKYTGTLSSSTDTVIQIWADGTSSEPASDSTYGSEAVWSDYAGVWHMQNANDSTAYGNNFAITGATSGYTGQIEDAYDFDGNDYGQIANQVELRNPKTVSAWSNGYVEYGKVVIFKDTAGNYYSIDCRHNHARFIWSMTNAGGGQYVQESPSSIVGVGFISGVITNTQSGTVASYLNGSLLASTATTNADIGAGGYLGIGRRPVNNDNYFNGIIDEVRLCKNLLSSTWISTEYNNQNSPSTFYTASDPSPSPTNTSDFFMIFG